MQSEENIIVHTDNYKELFDRQYKINLALVSELNSYKDRISELKQENQDLLKKKKAVDEIISAYSNKYRDKAKKLKEELLKTQKELEDSRKEVKLYETKIKHFKKSRNHSLSQINTLVEQLTIQEEEIIKSKTQTPSNSRVRKEKKSNTEIEIRFQRLPTFDDPKSSLPVNSSKSFFDEAYYESVIDDKEKIIEEEKKSNKELKTVIQTLQNEKVQLINKLDESKSKIREFEEKISSLDNQENSKVQQFVQKIDILRRENIELRNEIKEYEVNGKFTNESNEFDSEIRETLDDEIGKIPITPSGRNLFDFEMLNFGVGQIFQPVQNNKVKELSEEKYLLERKLLESSEEISFFKSEIMKYKQQYKDLGKILLETKKQFELMQMSLNPFKLKKNIENLLKQKTILEQEVEELKKQIATALETLKTTQAPQSDYTVAVQTVIKSNLSHGKNPESDRKRIKKTVAFPEDFKKRRNIASWGYDLLDGSYLNPK